jgi:glutamate--cysteine ligase
MSTLFGDSREAARPLRGMDDLLLAFSSGEKPRSAFGIGIEYERLPVYRETGEAVPYLEPVLSPRREAGSIGQFLEALSERGWAPQKERGRIIALERSGTRVTLEPGAQVELSGRVHQDLQEARVELESFVRDADALAATMGIAFIGLGLQPFTPVPRIGWVPKLRYGIMGPYLARRGHLAHHMMKATAGCQMNLDFGSEDEAMEMLRVAMGVTGIVTAICANSPLSGGQFTGFLTKRSHVWFHTDPDRCGLLPFALREGARYSDYAAYALDVPMMFVVRDEKWIDMGGRTFREYMADGMGLIPTRGDWQLHLTTLFPEVRLKAYLEVRGSDSGAPGMTLAQAALWKGLLYDARARRAAWELVRVASFEQRLAFQREVARHGLSARLAGEPALGLARELLAIAAGALPPHEATLLAPMRQVVEIDGAPPAAVLLSRWTGPWNRLPWRLVDALASAA